MTNHIKTMSNFTVVEQFLAVAGSDILFGPYSTSSLIIFLPTDAAWAKVVKQLGAPPRRAPAPNPEIQEPDPSDVLRVFV